jgi:hypothetical protein
MDHLSTIQRHTRVQGGLDLLEPGDVRMPSVEVAAHRFYQDEERGDLLQSAGLPPREDPFDPAIPLLVVGILPYLAPESRKMECLLRTKYCTLIWMSGSSMT